jgi:hypothetical protein
MRKQSGRSNARISVLILLLSAQATIAQIVSVSHISCTPTTLTSEATTSCTVELTGAAPSGGTEISLSSSNTLLPLPGNSVTVPQGSTFVSFTVKAGTIPSNQTATLTATALNSVLLRWDPSSSPGITGYRVYRGVTNGGPYSVLATLGVVNTYRDYNVRDGETYYYVTTAVSHSGTVSRYSDQAEAAVPAGVPRTATLSLVAPLLSSLTCSPMSLLSLGVTTCTVTLANSAPPDGTKVSIASDSTLLPVPASSVTVAAGSASTTFKAAAGAFGSPDRSVTLTATLGSGTKTATIELLAPALLTSLTCSPASLSSGQVTTCTIKLNNAAPTGTTVALSSNSGLLPVPAASITVPVGSDSTKFAARAGTITSNQTATLKATLNGVSQTTSINLVGAAGVGIASLSCQQRSLESDSITWCTVKLTAYAAAAAGITVTLSSNTSLLSVPPVATIPEGVDIAVFPAISGTVTESQTARITASVNSSSATVSLTLKP